MNGPGLVVVLDGPPGVGCSTTLAGLQRAWPRARPGPLLEVGLDAVLRGLGPGQRRWGPLVLAPSPRGTRWGPLGRELVAGLHRAAAAWAWSGVDVAVDHRRLDRATAADLHTALEGLAVLHVGLVCDPDVLEDRRGSRDDDGVGTEAGIERDLVLDTTEATTEELVERILADVATAGPA